MPIQVELPVLNDQNGSGGGVDGYVSAELQVAANDHVAAQRSASRSPHVAAWQRRITVLGGRLREGTAAGGERVGRDIACQRRIAIRARRYAGNLDHAAAAVRDVGKAVRGAQVAAVATSRGIRHDAATRHVGVGIAVGDDVLGAARAKGEQAKRDLYRGL